MVREDLGSIFRRKDGKYFVYIPQHVAEDSSFPFEVQSSVKVMVKITEDGKMLVEPAGERIHRPWGQPIPRKPRRVSKED